MNCSNCRVYAAVLWAPAEVDPGQIFQEDLYVDALESRPFTVRFDLVAATGSVPIPFTHLSSGGTHSCARRADGSLACWGSNHFRESVPPAGSFAQVSAGSGYTCGLRTDGSLACWGLDEYAQTTPPAGTDFTQVSAGSAHACPLRRDGSIRLLGQLQRGSDSAARRHRLHGGRRGRSPRLRAPCGWYPGVLGMEQPWPG